MPQPLINVVPGTGEWSSDPKSIESKPQIAISICKVHATWATLDGYLGLLFAEVSMGYSAASFAVYETLGSFEQKKKAIMVAAKTEVQLSELAPLDAVLDMIGRLGKERNRFAHWALGPVEGTEDAISLVNPKELSSELRLVRAMENAKDGREMDEIFSSHHANPVTGRILVYYQSDIDDLVDRMSDACAVVTTLISLSTQRKYYLDTVRPREWTKRISTRLFSMKRKLLSSEQFKKALKRSRKSLLNRPAN
ncbi:MAG: hypothetical protein AAF636_26625 [Pseudomonadota bacterium]